MVALKGVPALLSPELLYALARMGHGDEIVLADANFPTSSVCRDGPVEIRADEQQKCVHPGPKLRKLPNRASSKKQSLRGTSTIVRGSACQLQHGGWQEQGLGCTDQSDQVTPELSTDQPAVLACPGTASSLQAWVSHSSWKLC
ncbi:fucose mutarotase isoform X3 [Dasypus novemcinctus]|uniref:fucose mutarotase isoform X3 n=1 Tax=Dasypus novemcinctus TaxID=9361 RepID=UPI00265FAA37|nr:fucose mutarotase isoform X2 [Dasypus novemcinctus]